jgi:metal-sulfur cluster biosynthetic enzyme
MKAQAAQIEQTKAREAEVWKCLQSVSDPELDESVTELNFITKAEVDPHNWVHIDFRLPTYWCAANFSFLMADDMRRAVNRLDWVKGVRIVLCEHMYADTINAGLAKGLTFQETFGAEADGDLEELRQNFLIKAFQRRQVALLNHLATAGYLPETLVAMTLRELASLPTAGDGPKLLARYLERRGVVGPARNDALAFIDAEGVPLKAEAFSRYISGLRRVGVNAEFNSALCRGLLSVRFDLETPFVARAQASSKEGSESVRLDRRAAERPAHNKNDQ